MIFRTQVKASGKIEEIKKDKIEECLKGIRPKIKFIQRSPKLGEIEVRLINEKCAQDTALDPIYDNGFMMLPSYFDFRLGVIRIEEVQPEVKPLMVMTCFTETNRGKLHHDEC